MTDDTISRLAAITLPVMPKEYREYQTFNLDDAYEQGWNDLQKCIELLPLAQPDQRWIPVTKRLPKDLEEVNVTWVNHAPEQYYDFVKDKYFSGSAVYYKGSWYWYSSTCVDILAEYGRNETDKIDDGIEVVAWMSLPEPWKGESDGERKDSDFPS